MRLVVLWTLLGSLLLACDSGPERENPTPITHRDAGTAQGQDASTTSDGGPICGGDYCTSGDEQVACCCELGEVCGRWLDGCECLPGQPTDAGVNDGGEPPPDGGAPPHDAGLQDAGTPPQDAGTRDSGVTDAGSGLPPIPVYSQGSCPQIVNGENNNFPSVGGNRRFIAMIPPNPTNAPVVFAWHWWQGQPDTAASWTGLAAEVPNGLVVISPYQAPNSNGLWYNSGNPNTNPDVRLFDDILACLHEQLRIDLDRVAVHGHSLGGIFISYLVLHRSEWISAFAPLSGGLAAPSLYVPPARDIPGIIIWGGPSDTYGNFSFHTASRQLSQNLRRDGSFIVNCEGTFGHILPENPQRFIPFLLNHVRGQPSPYAGGLPPGQFPEWCNIAP